MVTLSEKVVMILTIIIFKIISMTELFNAWAFEFGVSVGIIIILFWNYLQNMNRA